MNSNIIDKPVIFTKDMIEQNKYLATLADGVNITFQSVADAMNDLESRASRINKPLFKTLIKIVVKTPGKPDKVMLETNTCVLGGRLRTLESAFGLKPTKEQHLSLNDNLDIKHSVDIYKDNDENYKNMKVLAFCIGDGARNKQDVTQEFKPTNCETKMYNIVPIRCVEENSDISEEEKKKYRGRKKITVNGKSYIAYYYKLFDTEKIHMEHEGADYVPKFDDTETVPKEYSIDPSTGEKVDKTTKIGPKGSTSPVYIYTKIKINIEKTEFKEYYKLNNNNSLIDAGINEIGLIMGVDCINNNSENGGETGKNEIANAELWAKMTTPHQTMAADNISVYMEYLVYA